MEELIYFIFILAQILISPFTKVEESFYLQEKLFSRISSTNLHENTM